MRKSLFFSAMAAGALAAAGFSPDAAAQRGRSAEPQGENRPGEASPRGALAPENASLDRRGLPTLDAGELRLADRMAADFFENSLRLSQSRRIEAETLQHYLSLSPQEREVFRAERRRFYRSLTPEQRLALRNVKVPAYNNLAEHQKERFREAAVSALSPQSSYRAPPALRGHDGGGRQDI